MKLLYISFETKAFEQALTSQFEVKHVVFSQIKKFDEYIIPIIDSFKPQIILKEDGGMLELKPETIKLMADTSQCYQWSQDVILDERKPIYDFAPFSTSLWSNFGNIDKMKAEGYKADYLQSSVDFDTYKYKGELRTKDVVFIANNYEQNTPLRKFRNEMVDFLKANYRNFYLFGNNWFEKADGAFIGGEKEAQAYAESLISINLSQYKMQGYSSDRIYKIMGCKSLCLAYDYPGLDLQYPFAVSWRGFDELKSAIDYYLEHDVERNHMINAAYEHTIKNHSWEVRAKQFKQLVEKWKQI